MKNDEFMLLREFARKGDVSNFKEYNINTPRFRRYESVIS